MTMKEIHVPIYNKTVVVIQTELLDNVVREYGLDEDMVYSSAFHFVTNDKMYLVFDFKSIKPSIIAHECNHCVCSVFINMGAKVDEFNIEPANYLLSFLIDECYKIVKLKK